MSMLGFTAEASLSETRGHHRSGRPDDRTLGAVRPAQLVFTDSTKRARPHPVINYLMAMYL